MYIGYYYNTKNVIMLYSGSKYEDNMEQVSGGSLSSAILNRNNPKYSHQTASTTATTTSTTTTVNTTTITTDFHGYYFYYYSFYLYYFY